MMNYTPAVAVRVVRLQQVLQRQRVSLLLRPLLLMYYVIATIMITIIMISITTIISTINLIYIIILTSPSAPIITIVNTIAFDSTGISNA